MATLVQVLGALVISVLYAALDGLLLFLPAAAVAGFLAWLFGGVSPRDTALTVGCIVGGLWTVAAFSRRLGAILEAIGKHRSSQRLSKLDEDDLA